MRYSGLLGFVLLTFLILFTSGGVVVAEKHQSEVVLRTEVFQATVTSKKKDFKAKVFVVLLDEAKNEIGIIFVNESGPPAGGGSCTIAAAKDDKLASKNVVTATVKIPLIGSTRSVMVRTQEFPQFASELRDRSESILHSFRNLVATCDGVIVGK